jgi:hypothetical protein
MIPSVININRNILLSLLFIIWILMTFVMGVLGSLLFASALFNIFLIRKSLSLQDEKEDIEFDLHEIYNEIDYLGQHLEKINRLHIYHGDETILELSKHLREVQNELIDFQVKYSTEPVVVIDEQGEEREYGTDEDEEEEAEEEQQ